MNRVGMIVDVTHVGRRSSLEALEMTTRPPLFSHSTPPKFASHDRNITDEQIRACAAKGSVVCLNGIGLFMDATQRRASASRLADTIEYVVQLVGPGHAGIGLDYIFDTESMARYFRTNMQLYGDGSQYPGHGRVDCVAPSALPDVVNELVKRNYAGTDIQGILGLNYLRVLDANS